MEQRLDSNNTRTHLDKSILAPIIDEKHSSTFVLSLEGLEKLIDNAPLFLHSLADPDFSPLIFTQHNVLIIGTLHLLDNKQVHDEDSSTMSCDERIEKFVLFNSLFTCLGPYYVLGGLLLFLMTKFTQ